MADKRADPTAKNSFALHAYKRKRKEIVKLLLNDGRADSTVIFTPGKIISYGLNIR